MALVRPRVLCVVFALGVGCADGGESAPIVTPSLRCAAGQWQREDGSCVSAGLPPDMRCPPGEWERDGACIAAGVPPDGCGQGFVHDGDRGCEPILPNEPCPPGFMAVPGETACREVAPCGPHKWGDIPVEADTEYVDASYAGTDSDGSALKPWKEVSLGVMAAAPGAIVAIAAGSYIEDVTVAGKPARLWGVCPGLVELVATGTTQSILAIYKNADGSEVHDIAVRGDAWGITVSGSLDVLLERVWIHDAYPGLAVEDDFGTTRVTLKDALVENNGDTGVYFIGSEATLERSVVRDTQPGAEAAGLGVGAQASTLLVRNSLVERNHTIGVYIPGSNVTMETSVVRDTQADKQGGFGYGVAVEPKPTTAAPSTLLLSTSLIANNRSVGVEILGSDATVEASVIRDTQPDAQGHQGHGVSVQGHPMTGALSTLVIRTSLLEANHENAVLVSGADATVEATAIRHTQFDAEGLGGRGVTVQAHEKTNVPSTLSLSSALIEENHDVGVIVLGSDATVQASAIRDTQPNGQGMFGRGLGVQANSTTGAPSALQLVSSVVEHSVDTGMFVAGSDVTVASSIISDTRSNARQGRFGRGLEAQDFAPTGTTSTLLLERSVVEKSHDVGVWVSGTEATVEASVVRETLPRELDGLFGDGFVVTNELAPASATLADTRIEGSIRGALAVFGASARYSNTDLLCQSVDLIGEAFQGQAYVVENLGGNRCGCPGADGECVLESAGFEPPGAVDSVSQP